MSSQSFFTFEGPAALMAELHTAGADLDVDISKPRGVESVVDVLNGPITGDDLAELASSVVVVSKKGREALAAFTMRVLQRLKDLAHGEQVVVRDGSSGTVLCILTVATREEDVRRSIAP